MPVERPGAGAPLDRRTFLKLTGLAVAYHSMPRVLHAAPALPPVFSTPAAAGSLADTCLGTLKRLGVAYGDIRIGHYRIRHISARDARLEAFEDLESVGFGVRVLDRGGWGFASSNQLVPEEVDRVTREAVAIARASALAAGQPVELAPEPVHADVRYNSPCARDPFGVPAEEQVAYLLETNAALKRNQDIKVAESSMIFWRRQQLFASTEGSKIESVLVRSGASETASAVDSQDSQERSYSISPLHGGYEHIEAGDLVGNAERVAAEAVEKLKAADASDGFYDLVLDPEHLSLVIHESCGHASELDRALGYVRTTPERAS